MDINFNTENFILIHYPPGAGGKFLQECLAISDSILHNNPVFANSKFNGKWDEQKSLRASCTMINLSKKYKHHIENDNGVSVFGFDHDFDKSSQIKNAKSLFKKLTNQTKFFFTMANHENYENFLHYKNSKNIFITGFDKLCKLRNRADKIKVWSRTTENYLDSFDNKIFFNIDSCFDKEDFFIELKTVFQKFKIKMIGKRRVEKIRKCFVNYNSKNWVFASTQENWDGKGYYKGQNTSLINE